MGWRTGQRSRFEGSFELFNYFFQRYVTAANLRKFHECVAVKGMYLRNFVTPKLTQQPAQPIAELFNDGARIRENQNIGGRDWSVRIAAIGNFIACEDPLSDAVYQRVRFAGPRPCLDNDVLGLGNLDNRFLFGRKLLIIKLKSCICKLASKAFIHFDSFVKDCLAGIIDAFCTEKIACEYLALFGICNPRENLQSV